MTVPVTIKKIDSKKAEVLNGSILPDDKIVTAVREKKKD